MNEEKKNHIPGIYNYCDRWCDKCSFTSQCLLFSNESKIATFEIMNDRLPSAEEMKEEIFESDEDNEEEKFDFEDFDDEDNEDDFLFSETGDDEDYNEEEKIDFDDTKEPPLLVEELAHQYFEEAHSLLKIIDGKFKFSSTPKDNISLPQLKSIYESFEIISWYHTFLYVKIKRAAHGKKEYLRYKNEDLREFPKSDSDGTAKVAAISVQNSIKAFSKLQEYLPDYASQNLKLISLLQRILNEIEREFPDYHKFKRPGLDD